MSDTPTLGRLWERARKKAIKERNIQMLREHLAGETVREVARRHGLSSGRVRVIINRLTWLHFRGTPHHQLPADIADKLKALQEP